MATWHQNRSKTRLWHPTLWTVLDDPPNAGRSLMLFPNEREANDYVARRNTLGTGQHCYVLVPGTSVTPAPEGI
jgi:hypothetical protein